MKNLFVREIKEGETIPKGWGVVYFNRWKRTATIHPVPLNFVVAFLRSWYWVMVYPKDKKFEDEKKWYSAGYSDGFRDGSKK